MQKKPIILLAAGHMFSDINQGALPALLPFLMATRNFSYATAAGLVFMANLSSSLAQPIFGHIADRYRVTWFVPVGILAAGVGVVLAALLPAYWMMLAAVALSGLGIAAFHPEATLLVNRLSGGRKGTGMGMFAVGGNLGFALGPLLTTAALLWFGFRGAVVLVVPGILAAVLFLLQMPRLQMPAASSTPGSANNRARDAWWPFAWLTATVVLRSIVFFGLNTFLSLYWISELQQSKTAGNTALSIVLLSGAVGTLLGGRMADKHGNGAVFAGSLLGLPVLLLLLLGASRVPVATALLVPLGLLLFAPFSVMVVMAQQFLPNHPGVASGVTLGLAASVGGIVTPLFGRIGDRYGLHASMTSLLWVACATFLLAIGTVRSSNAWKVHSAQTESCVVEG
jgi:FSR family fosmidomycin resistance protein-like MFS transporter